MHFVEMQIRPLYYVVTLTLTLILTLDILNPELTGFDTVSNTVPSFKSLRSWIFVLSC